MHESMSFRNVIQTIMVIIGVLIVLAYVVFQARFLLTGPQIMLTEEPPRLNNSRQVFLTGQAYNITHLWLNDRPIYTNANGAFREALVLENGYTVTTLRAIDRYGRETAVTRSFVYVPASFIQ